jgi:glycosyltransferase involved in cell wall biosynthesis/GT2 family glycosyltransferase
VGLFVNGKQESPISIAICAFNALEYTRLLVDSIRRHSRYDHEILIYSDGSSDATSAWLREQRDTVWQHDRKNRGICTAMNRVGRMATREYLFFPNTDHVLAPGWDEALIPRLSPRKVVSLQCIEPGIVPVAQIFHTLNCGTRWDEFDGRRFNEAVESLSKSRESPGINYPFVISKRLWEEVGGLDERFDPGPANDPDLFYRLYFAGAELVRAEDVIIYHFSGKSSRMADESRQERLEWHRITDRNEGRFVQKWGERYRYVNGSLPNPGPEARRRWNDMRPAGPRVKMTSRLNVVVDARSAGPHSGGVGLYTRNLVRALARHKASPRVHCLVGEVDEGWKSLGNESAITLSPCGTIQAIVHQERQLLAREIGLAKGNIFHGPAFYVPTSLGIPSVVTVHDLAFMIHPEWYPKSFVDHLTRVCRDSIGTASAVIADSESTRRDILARFPEAARNVHTVLDAVPEESLHEIDPELVARIKEAYSGGAEFILSVGVQQRRKNATGLLEAYALMRRNSRRAPKLILVGGQECEDQRLLQLIKSHGLTGDVILTGSVPSDVLVALYESASVFAYPSLYEGFGFPPLEAMAHGVPVVCSNRGALPEVVGSAAKQVDPEDHAALARALEQVLVDADYRKSLIDLGMQQVARYSWDKVAEETLAIYNTCLESTPVLQLAPADRSESSSARPGTSSRLRVAVDARMIGASGTGTGRYTSEILRALWAKDRSAEYVVIGPELSDKEKTWEGAGVLQHVVAGPETLQDPAWEQFSLPTHLLGCDVFFAPTGIVPVARPCRAVQVVHDLGFQDHPDFYSPALRAHLGRWVRSSCLTADRLIAVSAFTQDRVHRHYQVPLERIRIVHHGRSLWKARNPMASRKPARSGRPYLLCLGSFEPNKNQSALLDAFRQISKNWMGELVLAGRRGRDFKSLQSQAKTLGLSDRVRFVVDPSDEDLQRLLEEAIIFVYPSLYEGFGLPIVEAMANGLPIITSRNGSCSEVAGDAAMVVDEPTAALLGRALQSLLCDESARNQLSTRARARAERFTWERAADETWAVLESCAGTR